MRTLRTVAEVHAALAQQRRAGAQIGLVPTMGAFHGGHLSLMRRAREHCDLVVVSLFVNPTQFDQRPDLDAYPRDEYRDAALAAEVGVDLLFAPAPAEIYPNGFATTVSVAGIGDTLEGAHRGRGHFDGVATVVTKLFGIVRPDVAYFGEKDAQQVQLIRRLVQDLNLDVEIEVCPIVRDPDGLALSSRNARLGEDDRRRARSLHRALTVAADAIAAGERRGAEITRRARAELDAAGVVTEYFELVDAETMAPVAALNGRPVRALVAARVGPTRLIDNEVMGGD